MPTDPLPDTDPDFLPFATTALDFHRAITLHTAPTAASRTELDALHAHLTALYGHVDTHTTRTSPIAAVEGDHLRACRIRLWQATGHLHAAFHTAPDRPEGAPDLAMCRRHLATSMRVRRDHTPADLRDPFTGLTRH